MMSLWCCAFKCCLISGKFHTHFCKHRNVNFLMENEYRCIFSLKVCCFCFSSWTACHNALISHKIIKIVSIHFCVQLSAQTCVHKRFPDGKVHGTNTGPIWGWQDPGGPMLVPWTLLSGLLLSFQQDFTIEFHGVHWTLKPLTCILWFRKEDLLDPGYKLDWFIIAEVLWKCCLWCHKVDQGWESLHGIRLQLRNGVSIMRSWHEQTFFITVTLCRESTQYSPHEAH